MKLPARVVSATLLVVYVVFVGAVLTEYDPDVARGVVGGVAAWLEGLGVPEAMAEPRRVEFLLNAAMFAPIVFLAAMTFPRHPWANWVVYAFVLSAAVELFQGVFLPPRTAQMVDVVANTLGALVGAALAAPLTRFTTPAPEVRAADQRPRQPLG